MSKLRLVIINLGTVAIGLILILAAGEIYFRVKYPFWEDFDPKLFVPSIGFSYPPNTEILHTNRLDFWAKNQSNSLGFADREPLTTELYESNCHVAIIGDSFVEALQVPLEDKMQIRLEKLANKKIPDFSIKTTAWGHSGAGQLNQLTVYDKYVRRLKPKVVVLVFVSNDFSNNTSVLESFRHGWDPDRPPLLFAAKSNDKIEFIPIDRDWKNHILPLPKRNELLATLLYNLKRSWFLTWILEKAAVLGYLSINDHSPKLEMRVDVLSKRPHYAHINDGRIPVRMSEIDDIFVEEEHLPPIYQDAIDFTGFALDEYKKLAERDGFSLVILSSHSMRAKNDRLHNHLEGLARSRNIPIIDQYQYIVDAGHNIKDAHFPHDYHWSPMGHQWAAEALFNYLQKKPESCSM